MKKITLAGIALIIIVFSPLTQSRADVYVTSPGISFGISLGTPFYDRVWVPGHWEEKYNNRVWFEGYWEDRHAPGYPWIQDRKRQLRPVNVWVPGHWERWRSRMVWVKGYWDRKPEPKAYKKKRKKRDRDRREHESGYYGRR